MKNTKTTKQKFEEIIGMEDPQKVMEAFNQIPLDEIAKFRTKIFWEAVTASLKHSQGEITEHTLAKAWMKHQFICEVEEIRMGGIIPEQQPYKE